MLTRGGKKRFHVVAVLVMAEDYECLVLGVVGTIRVPAAEEGAFGEPFPLARLARKLVNTVRPVAENRLPVTVVRRALREEVNWFAFERPPLF